MRGYTILLHLPDDWSDRTCEILCARLAQDELPEGIECEVAYWDTDEQAYTPVYSVQSGL